MTNINSIIQQTIKELILECHDDHVSLWSIIAALRHKGIQAPTEQRQITMKIVRALLNEKDIVAFNYCKPRYYIWNLSLEDAVARIEGEWDEIGHNPRLGDKHIVWFTSKELANSLKKKDTLTRPHN